MAPGQRRRGGRIDRGFDEYYGLMDGCCNFFDPAQPDPPYKGGRVRAFGHNDQRITEFPDDFYTTDAFSDHAADDDPPLRQDGQAVLRPRLLHGPALPAARQAGGHRQVPGQIHDGLGRAAQAAPPAADWRWA